MKITGHMERWGAGVLGIVSLALLGHLVFQINRGRAGDLHRGATAPRRAKSTKLPSAKSTSLSSVKSSAGKPNVPSELSRYNSVVELGLLKQLDDRPLPELSRNPFESKGVQAPTVPSGIQAPAPVPMPAQPPPPPPVTLKPMGYSEGKGGVREAMVSDEDQVYVVHEGDSVGTRYKVVKISPTVITVEDVTIHQTVDLPIPQ